MSGDGSTSRLLRFGDLGEHAPFQEVSACTPITLGPRGSMSLHVVVDGGTDGLPPSDEPIGQFEVFTSGDEVAPPCPFEGTDARGTPIASLLTVAGNAAVNIAFSLVDLPGARAWIRYARDTGGGPMTRARVWVTVR